MTSSVAGVTTTLLLIDGHSMAFRAFFALPAENFQTTTGVYTNAVYGFTSMLLRLIETEKPSHIAVAFDLPGGTFRTEEYAEYKAGREATPEEFKGQVDLIKEVLTCMGITHLTKDNYEADDILATLAYQGNEAKWRVLVASGDRDSFQMVTDRVTVIYPGASTADLRYMTPEAVEDKYGVRPSRYPELAALVGESADNLPGVPGVGPKTAAQWLAKFDGLDNLLAHADKVTGKRGEALRAHREAVVRNRRLNHLLTDLDVGVVLEDLRRCAVDRPGINALFDVLEFNTLRKRVFSLDAPAVTTAALMDEAPAASPAGRATSVFGAKEYGSELPPVDLSASPRLVGAPNAAAHSQGDSTSGHAADSGTTGGSGGQGGSGDVGAGASRAASAVELRTMTLHPLDEAALASLAAHLSTGGEVALRMTDASSSLLGARELIGLAMGTDAYIGDPADLTPATEKALADLLAGGGCLVHDGKKEWHRSHARGLCLGIPVFDTQLAGYLLQPDQRSADLAALALAHLGIPEWTSAPEQDQDALFAVDSPDTLHGQAGESLAQELGLMLDLAPIMHEKLHDANQESLLADMELPVQHVLALMENRGIAVDSERLDSLANELGRDVDTAQQAAWAIAGEEVNLSSPKQLQALLFDKLGLPKTKKTKTGYTTNAEALVSLYDKTGHPFLEQLLIHRDRIKLKQMVETLRAAVTDDGRIHSTFSQVIASTGRLASSDPNLQNIPTRSEEGRRIRHAFVAGEGYETLMSADYSQIEMRIMAHMSKDEGLIDAFTSGEDLHTTMASMIFGVPVGEVTSEQRSRTKATSYGLAYGLSPYGLSQQLSISVGEATALRDRYFERFGGVQRYLNQIVAQARKDGYTSTLFGRRRFLPDLNSANRQRREIAERAALNAPIQGTAADIMKIAMVNVENALASAALKSRMLLQIHDELLIEVAPGEHDAVRSILLHEMSHAVELSLPLGVAVGEGHSWREAAH